MDFVTINHHSFNSAFAGWQTPSFFPFEMEMSTSYDPDDIKPSTLPPSGVQNFETKFPAQVELKSTIPRTRKRRPKTLTMKEPACSLIDGYIGTLRRNKVTVKEIVQKVNSKFNIKRT